jgi:hypothetical protein
MEVEGRLGSLFIDVQHQPLNLSNYSPLHNFFRPKNGKKIHIIVKTCINFLYAIEKVDFKRFI